VNKFQHPVLSVIQAKKLGACALRTNPVLWKYKRWPYLILFNQRRVLEATSSYHVYNITLMSIGFFTLQCSIEIKDGKAAWDRDSQKHGCKLKGN
jgi:hypothetical protein